MPANLENSSVATGLEKVSFHSNPKERQCQRMLRLLHNCTHLQFSSVVQSCPTLCSPMNCSSPGLPVHHQLPEFTQTHVHRVSDAIQPSHPLSSPDPPAFNLSSIRVLSNESPPWVTWPKYWIVIISPSNEKSGLISFRMNWFDFL